jgi:hypothetical protein
VAICQIYVAFISFSLAPLAVRLLAAGGLLGCLVSASDIWYEMGCALLHMQHDAVCDMQCSAMRNTRQRLGAWL